MPSLISPLATGFELNDPLEDPGLTIRLPGMPSESTTLLAWPVIPPY